MLAVATGGAAGAVAGGGAWFGGGPNMRFTNPFPGLFIIGSPGIGRLMGGLLSTTLALSAGGIRGSGGAGTTGVLSRTVRRLGGHVSHIEDLSRDKEHTRLDNFVGAPTRIGDNENGKYVRMEASLGLY